MHEHAHGRDHDEQDSGQVVDRQAEGHAKGAGGDPLIDREVQPVLAEAATQARVDDDHGQQPGDHDGGHRDDPGAGAQPSPDERRQSEARHGQHEQERDERLHGQAGYSLICVYSSTRGVRRLR